MSNEQFDSVWDAIEESPAEAENLRIRAGLIMALTQRIEQQRWTQEKAAAYLSVTQPRISDLMRGKIDLFGLDSLVNMVVASGLHLEFSVTENAA